MKAQEFIQKHRFFTTVLGSFFVLIGTISFVGVAYHILPKTVASSYRYLFKESSHANIFIGRTYELSKRAVAPICTFLSSTLTDMLSILKIKIASSGYFATSILIATIASTIFLFAAGAVLAIAGIFTAVKEANLCKG